MLYKIYPDSPDQRKIKQIVDILEKGGVIIYPTDTVYAFGCSLMNKRAIERLAKLKDSKMKHANFSIVFYDLSSLADYTKAIDRPTYKILNKNLPGPFTFILEASARIPKLFETNKKTVGIRIPNHKIVQEIVRQLGHPLVTGSLHDEDAILEYSTDPDMIFEKWNNMVDAIIDGGYGKKEPSTVVDLSGDELTIIRQGIGELQL
ncbi:MAG: threonylcarbamoyl-AMP synthase [Bacteroidetes bacterium]|nr:threonylcarbamoyl-AMP synthase [Bacteroidota bacterium]